MKPNSPGDAKKIVSWGQFSLTLKAKSAGPRRRVLSRAGCPVPPRSSFGGLLSSLLFWREFGAGCLRAALVSLAPFRGASAPKK